MSIFSWVLPLAAGLLSNRRGAQRAVPRRTTASTSGTSEERSEAARLGFLMGLMLPATTGTATTYSPGEDVLDWARRTGVIRDEQPRSMLTPQQVGGLAYPRNPVSALLGGLFGRVLRSGDRGQGGSRGAVISPWLPVARRWLSRGGEQATVNTPQMRLPKPDDLARTINLTWGQQQMYRDLLSRLMQPVASSPFAYQQLAGPYLGYMQRALEGRAGLPEEGYRTALQQGMDALAAQAAEARRALAEEFARRGLTQSGLMARALRGVEAARLAGVQDLLSDLAMQGLQARVEAQRLAAQQLPQMYGIQAGALGDVARLWLQQQLAELQRSELAQALKRQQAEQDMATWEALGTVLGGLVRW